MYKTVWNGGREDWGIQHQVASGGGDLRERSAPLAAMSLGGPPLKCGGRGPANLQSWSDMWRALRLT